MQGRNGSGSRTWPSEGNPIPPELGRGVLGTSDLKETERRTSSLGLILKLSGTIPLQVLCVLCRGKKPGNVLHWKIFSLGLSTVTMFTVMRGSPLPFRQPLSRHAMSLSGHVANCESPLPGNARPQRCARELVGQRVLANGLGGLDLLTGNHPPQMCAAESVCNCVGEGFGALAPLLIVAMFSGPLRRGARGPPHT